MNDDHKITDSDYIAWCAMCSLADAMKDCKRCRFNIGLPFRLIKAEESRQDTEIKARTAGLKPYYLELISGLT
jgi:hypothetical protein